MTTRTPAPVPVDTGAAAPVALDRAAAPVPVPVDTTPVLRPPPERAPAPVNVLADPELPRAPIPVLRPAATEAAPAPDPYPQEPVAVVVPVEEQPVSEPLPEPTDDNITPDTSRYITVSEDGAVVLINASTLNFVGVGVSVTSNDSTATITVTSAAEYGDANVVTLLAAYGSNTVSTTGNVIAGRFTGNGRGLTDIAWSNVTGSPAFVTLADFSVSTNTASGNGSLSYNNSTGVFSFTPADASLSNYGDANVTVLLADLGSNNISGTGNITAGNFSVTGNSVTWSNAGITQTSAADIAITGDGQVTIRSLDGTYQWTFGSSGDFAAPGNISASANVTANYFLGNGSALTDLPYGNVIENGNTNVTINAPNGDVIISVGTKTWTFEVNGNTTIPGNILGIDGLTLDNRFSEVQSDIQLLSADDILLQGRDRPVGSDVQGGDINIYAGDSGDDHGVFAPSSGGDVEIEGGRGGTGNVNPGGDGGYISIRAGHGGDANVGGGGGSAGSGADITLIAGNAGTNSGNIELGNVGGQVLVSAGNSSGNGSVGGSVTITTGHGGPNAGSGAVQINIPASDAGAGGTWTFDYAGDFTLPSQGNVSAGNISANVAGFAIGYLDIPQIAFTGNATIAAADAGKHFYSTESTDYILTIADNSSVSWSVGTAVTVVNRGTGNITVVQAAGVSLYLAGNSTAGNRTVTTYGMATVLNVAANVWMINGTGVA